MPATIQRGTRVTHARSLTYDISDTFSGPHAAKRMASEYGWAVSTCKAYLARRRALSLDAAIEAAAKNDKARAALLLRIEQARERHADNHRARVAGRVGAVHVAVEQVPDSVGAMGATFVVGDVPGQAAAAQRVVSPTYTGPERRRAVGS